MIHKSVVQLKLWDYFLFPNCTKTRSIFQVISEILDSHPEILDLVWQDLNRKQFSSTPVESPFEIGKTRSNRKSRITAEQVLRILIYKQIHQFSYRKLVEELKANLIAKEFTRLYTEEVPSYGTLNKWINRISPETAEKINAILCNSPKILPPAPGRKKQKRLRVDCTVVETNIAPPSDSRLLVKGIEVLQRLCAGLSREESWLCCSVPNLHRSARKLGRRISAIKGKESRKRRRMLYIRLFQKVEQMVRFAHELFQAAEDPAVDGQLKGRSKKQLLELKLLIHLVYQVLHQAKERILHGRQVPSARKVVSLFEEHTDIIMTGKRKDPQFGHKILISENEYGLIGYFKVFRGNPNDARLVSCLIEEYLLKRGIVPKQIVFDRGFDSRENLDQLEKIGIVQVCLPKRGYKSREVKQREKEPWFRELMKWRSGIEGRISYLKRDFALRRCPLKGWEHFQLHVGFAIVSHNLVKLAIKTLEIEERKRRRRKYGGRKAA